MNEYEVMITESQWYKITVTAESAEDAEKQAWAIFDKSGFDEFEFEGAEIEPLVHIEEI
jgi:hypothetical protein